MALTDSSYADTVTSASWSYDGSTLYTSCKDNSVKIYDPRAATASATALTTPHKGTKVRSCVVTQSLLLGLGLDSLSLTLLSAPAGAGPRQHI